MAWPSSGNFASWTGRVKITVDGTKVDEPIPFVRVSLSGLPTEFWDTAVLGEIRVSQSDGETEVAHWIPSSTFNTTTDTGVLFFKSSDMNDGANTDYYIYWDNPLATGYAVTDTYGRNAVFSSYAGFYFPGLTTDDVTGGGRNLTAVNSPGTAASDYEGIDAATYNGSNQYHSYSGTQAVTDWPLTVEGLIYTNNVTADRNAVALAGSASAFNQAALVVQGTTSGDPIRFAAEGASGSTSVADSSTGVTVSTWHYAAGNRDANSGTSTAYIDGGSAGSNTTTLTAPSFDRFSTGARLQSTINYFNGSVAAAYLSSSVRSADYVSTMNRMWSSGFYSVGAYEAGGVATETTDWVEFLSVSGATAGGGTVTWTSIGNALTNIATFATADIPMGELSYQARFTNPGSGFNSAIGREIYGAEVEVAGVGEDAGSRYLSTYVAQLIKSGSPTGSNRATGGVDQWLDTSPIYYKYYGGPADLWGTTLLDTDVTSSSFGVMLQFGNDDPDTALMSLARVRMRITHEAGAVAATNGFFAFLW